MEFILSKKYQFKDYNFMMTVTGQHIQLTLRKSVTTIVDKFTTNFLELRKHSPYFLFNWNKIM